VQLHLRNDSPSFTPVHPQIRAIGPQLLHHAKGRGQPTNQTTLSPHFLRALPTRISQIMISVHHKTIFIHIPKCAGQSVGQAFLSDIDPSLTWKNHRYITACFQRPPEWSKRLPPRLAHLKAEQIINNNILPQSLFDDYLKFSVVRDPYDRTFSMWKYLYNRGLWKILGAIRPSFRLFVNVLLPFHVNSGNFFFESQSSYIYNKSKSRLLVDKVLKYENLEAEFAEIAKLLKLSNPSLPRINVSRKNYLPFNKHLAHKIQELYHDDYEKLNYMLS
jgi:hypothetical protein